MTFCERWRRRLPVLLLQVNRLGPHLKASSAAHALLNSQLRAPLHLLRRQRDACEEEV